MIRIIISIIFLIFIFIPLNASDYFQILVDSAYKNNFYIKSYEKIVEYSKENIKLSKSYFLPVINFNYSFTQTDEPANSALLKTKQGKLTMKYYTEHMANPPYVKNHQYIISLLQPIFSKGNVILSKKQAELNYEAQLNSLNEIKREIKFKIFQTLIDAYKIMDYIDIANNIKDKSETYLKTITNFYKNGISLKSDLLFAKYNYKKAVIELNNIKNNLNKPKNALKQLTGKYFEIKKINFKYNENINENELINYAINNRNDIVALKKYLKISEIEIRKNKNENLPSIYGFANYEKNSHDFFDKDKEGITFGVQLKFNIFNGFRNNIEINKAKLNYLKMKNLLLEKEEQIKNEIKDAIIDFENAKFSYETYKSLVKSNKIALELSENRFNQGLERITTLVDMQTNYKTSLKELSQAKWNLILKYYTILFKAGKF